MRTILAVFLFLTVLPSARAQETLRWKLKKGQVLHYRWTCRVGQEAELAKGVNEVNELNYIHNYVLRVKNVDDAGIAQIEVTLDRLRYQMKTRGVRHEYDSNQKAIPSDAPEKAVKKPWEIGVPRLVTMDSRGVLQEIAWPKEILEKNEKDGVSLGIHGAERDRINIISVVQSDPIILPDHAISPGDSWTFSTHRNHSGIPNANVHTFMNYHYMDSRDGLVRFTLEKKVAVTGAREAGDNHCTGLVRFDPVAGLLRDVDTVETSISRQKRRDGSGPLSTFVRKLKVELIENDAGKEQP